MKMIAGVLLSLSLLLTGLPVPSQNPAWCNTESTTKEVKETGSETDVQQEEAGTIRKENVQGEEDGTSDAPEKKEQNINEKEAEKQEPPAYREEKAEEQKPRPGRQPGRLPHGSLAEDHLQAHGGSHQCQREVQRLLAEPDGKQPEGQHRADRKAERQGLHGEGREL